jgi:antitoxin FitA
MPALQIRDVPEDVHEALKRRAEQEGKSLNRLLLDELRMAARRDRNREIFERAARRPWEKLPAPGEAARIIRAQRDAAADAG